MVYRLPTAVMLIALVASCASPTDGDDSALAEPGRPNRDAVPGGLFHDFFVDGKFDAAGHPSDAEVFEGEARCAPTTGFAGDLGIAADARKDSVGALCAGTTRDLGDGTFALNVRALLAEPADDVVEPVLHIKVFDAGQPVADRAIMASEFGDAGAERDLAVMFVHYGTSEVTFEVTWTGVASARLTYVEVFRSTPRLVISPASQTLMPDAEPTFEIELQDPPDALSFDITCDGVDVSGTLTELLGSGEAEWVETDFRVLVSAPAARLFEGCAAPSKVTVNAMVRGWAQHTSRVTYRSEPIPCAFTSDDPDRVRVLLTGFEPFPANSDRDNSSKEAVEAYVAGPLPEDVAVMRAVLPVEYDAAPALLDDLITRCQPDVVIGFGQGRSYVDIETTAYNRKDSAAVAGGVPDNRGVVYGGDPIVADGPAERETGLPVDSILTRLDALGIEAGPSTDPGRYVCNNLFYAIMAAVTDDRAADGGFVHLPRIAAVSTGERETLRQTVDAVVSATVGQLRAAAK